MEDRKERVRSTLSKLLRGKTVIVGIGNVLKGDDAFGPRLVERLNGRVKSACIDAGTAPENYTGKITGLDPDFVLLIDAVYLDEEPGSYDILGGEELVKSGFTTHDLSPAMFMEFLESGCGADIYMLAVQPGKVDFGEEMTESVEDAIKELTSMILEVQNA